MKYLLVILLITMCGKVIDIDASNTQSKDECHKYLQAGIDHFQKRDENAEDWVADPFQIDQAIFSLNKSINCNHTRQEAAYYLLRSLHFKAMYTSLPDQERKLIYNEAKVLGEKLIDEYPNDVGIKVWYLASLGKWIQFYGIIRAAYEGLGPKTKAIAESIIELDPLYENGIGYRILGIVYYQAPYIPVLLTWPDDEKGIKLTHKSLEINPNNIGNLLFMGKIYYLDEQFGKARFYFEKCLNQNPRKDYLIMERFDQMKAREFLSLIESEENVKP